MRALTPTILIAFLLILTNAALADVAPDSLCAGAQLSGLVPDPQNLYHRYGTRTDLGEFDIGTEFTAFDSTFELYVMNGVVSRWSADSVRVFCSKILNDDPNDTYDIFPRIWEYFCFADDDPSYEGISVDFGGGLVLNKISIYLFDTANINCNGDYTYECSGDHQTCYGLSHVPGLLSLVVNASQWKRQYGQASYPPYGCSLRTVDSVVRRGFGHEVQHCCFNANGYPPQYVSANESFSTLSEWISRAVQEKGVDVSYDASIFRGERCDAHGKYYVEQTWMAYLYEAYDGDNEDITDDLVYRWIRKQVNGQRRITMRNLAAVLAESDFAWVGGATGDERLATLFEGYAIAKFANAPNATSDSRFGYSDYDPQREVAMFKDEATYYWGLVQNPPQTPVPSSLDCPGIGVPQIQFGNWNVRILPPEFVLDDDLENDTRLITGTYTLDVPTSPAFDGSVDKIDVALYGTDYIVFRADEYFQDGEEHELHCDLRQVSPALGAEYQVKVWAVGYDTATGDLTQQASHIEFIEPVKVENNNASLVVTDFGGSIKSVVLVITLVEAEANDVAGYAINSASSYYFTYEYEFGVVTRATANAIWNGTVLVLADVTVPSTRTLTVSPGAAVRVNNSDAGAGGVDQGKIEVNVEGTLSANGTPNDSIVFESWNPTTTEDWVGFYFDDQSDGGTFNHCIISRAEYAIESYVPLTVTSTTIEDCRYAGVVSQAGGALVQGCTFTDPGSYGVFLSTDTTLVRNTVIDNAVSAALHVQPNASVTVRASQLLNSDTGLYHSGDSQFAHIDSNCVFSGNAIGIHYYDTGTMSSIMRSSMHDNSQGIACDEFSHPVIRYCTVEENGMGILCTNSSEPTIRNNRIRSNDSGVVAATGGNPDIGTYSTTGFNTITANVDYHVVNYNEVGIVAQNNSWGKTSSPCGPKATKLYGPVDVSYPLCYDPNATSLIEREAEMPRATTGISAIVPNPFNPTTTVHYSLAAGGAVQIRVYDVAGRFVRELVNRTETAGDHAVPWNGVDRTGNPVASGIYFVKMDAGWESFTRNMVLLK